MHITWINNFFKKINIKKGYKKYIIDQNIKKFSLIVRNNIDIFFSSKILIKINKNAILQVNFVSTVKKITKDLK